MELTQRLECTQNLYSTQSEKEFPDQIGFLGICGSKYPVRKGPNKIGRDPETCNIVLNLNSISRQHAVINVLNSHEFMLMDLDSANKTKLSNKTLQAYIPHPLKNGDMVQFGNVFGVFRLIEEDNDLPMTQALDIPETPVQNRHVSRINAHVTTVPESPDVSDKDDSFIVASQQKPKEVFKSPSNNFIKPSGKTISIKPIGLNKIDNVFWSSSKKSDSFSLQSNSSINDISVSDNDITIQKNIHEEETQVVNNECDDSIYNANTQFITKPPSPTIYSMDTQIPTDLPEVCKIPDQRDLQFNFVTENKENDNNIFNAETQLEFGVKESNPDKNLNENDIPNNNDNPENKHDTSNEIILFDEIESQPLDENIESQAILPPNLEPNNDLTEMPEDLYPSQDIGYTKKRVVRLKSDSSTDCEDIDIPMTPKIAENKVVDDDETDCEDEIDSKHSEKINNADIDDDITDCEDNFEDVFLKPNKSITFDKDFKKSNEMEGNKTNIEDMPNQVIQESDVFLEPNKLITLNKKSTESIPVEMDANKINLEDMCTQVIGENIEPSKLAEMVTPFEDLPTQIIDEDIEKPICFEEELTQKIAPDEVVTPFKVPKGIPQSSKKKIVSDLSKVQQIINNEVSNDDDEDEKYYAATQQIFDDLCSQKELPSDVNICVKPTEEKVTAKSSQESDDDSDMEEKINNFVTRLSESQIRDVVGVKKTNNDTLSSKPKNPKTKATSVLDDNESKQKQKKETSSKSKEVVSEAETLPKRVITRIRKPTPRMQHCDDSVKDLCDKIHRARNNTDQNAENEMKQKNEEQIKPGKRKSEDKNKASNKKNNKDKNKEKEHDKEKVKSKKISNETRGSKKKKNDSAKSNQKTIIDMICSVNKHDYCRVTRSGSQKTDVNDIVIDQPKEKTTKDQSKDRKTRRKNDVKLTEKKDPSPEVRRSRRQKSSQKNDISEQSDIKSATNVSKTSLETSTVYNLSSDSNADTSNKFKRQASGDDLPSAKKSKPETSSNNLSLRSTSARKAKTHYVLFTAFPCEEVKVKLEKLGAIIVTDVSQCTVVLTMQIKRTFKLLCAVGLGKPIVGPAWVQACADTNMIVDPWLHLIKDEATEKRFQFNLARSLGARRGFLRGYNVSCTPNVMPNAQEMKLIVECSGGTWKPAGPNWVCVSSFADKALWPTLKKNGAAIVSTEFILAGVLRQKVEINPNKLV